MRSSLILIHPSHAAPENNFGAGGHFERRTALHPSLGMSLIIIIIITIILSAIAGFAFFWGKKSRLSSFTFRQNSNKEDIPYCTVCLDEFKDGERLRKLPKCNHCFHLGCIDAWFQAHSTCPLCRNQVFILHHDRNLQPCSLLFFSLSFLFLILRKLGSSLRLDIISVSLG